ncbi:leucine-rich repeat/extensin 1 [Actinidia rufa]|uniref:Leucine-rich repeat/extensin 1 n=1 Tax=Actinidia rufa TaxID=165716 RepID=A0A7J0FYA0_9ERIC|nr:leucine-rich repeat/extensin 1 [Actinidia rufa]
MQSEGSLETTAASTNTGKYRCILCRKIFNTIQAVCGHQNAHRNDPRKRKPTHECVPNKRPTFDRNAMPSERGGGGLDAVPSGGGLDLNAVASEGDGGGGLDLNAVASEGDGGGGLDLNAMHSEGGGGGEELDLELRL